MDSFMLLFVRVLKDVMCGSIIIKGRSEQPEGA